MGRLREMLAKRDFVSNSACLAGVVLAHGMLFFFLANAWIRTVPPLKPAVIAVALIEAKTSGKEQADAETGRQERARKTAGASVAQPPIKQDEQQRASNERESAPMPLSETFSVARPQGSDAGMATEREQGPASGSLVLPRSDAAHLNNPKPVYPAISRRLGEQGNVRLRVHILSDGRVGEVRLEQTSGHPRLDQSAIEAVRRWRYVPARQNGVPVDYWYRQTVIFSLKS